MTYNIYDEKLFNCLLYITMIDNIKYELANKFKNSFNSKISYKC